MNNVNSMRSDNGLNNLMNDLICWIKTASNDTIEVLAKNVIGQGILSLSDQLLWIIEKSAEWTIPAVEDKANQKEQIEKKIIRPLPWILFIPLLLILRVSRDVISFNMSILGKGPLNSDAIAVFIKNIRAPILQAKVKDTNNIIKKNIWYFPNILIVWMDWFINTIKYIICFKSVYYKYDDNCFIPLTLEENEINESVPIDENSSSIPILKKPLQTTNTENIPQQALENDVNTPTDETNLSENSINNVKPDLNNIGSSIGNENINDASLSITNNSSEANNLQNNEASINKISTENSNCEQVATNNFIAGESSNMNPSYLINMR